MNVAGELFSSITWWESATIDSTLFAAFLQSISALFSLIAYFRKRRHPNQTLVHVDRKLHLERSSLALAGFAAVVALVASFCSIKYATLSDRDIADLHSQTSETKSKLITITDQLTLAEQQLATAKQKLQEVDGKLAVEETKLTVTEQQLTAANQRTREVAKQQDLATLIMRMNDDDAYAYDYLRTFKGTPPQNADVKEALEAVVEAHRFPYTKQHGQWKHVLSSEEVANTLSLEGIPPNDRLYALEILMTEPLQFKFFPTLVRMAISNPSLDVRTAATQVLRGWTANDFHPLDNQQLRLWWETNGKKDYALLK